ncbi:MAG: M6 family metalloprotease domain-containing protein, partial [Synergistaceae bacterium]|nr:M6 family metalloprotease domain-containing protein [Synergistaceae bacterium]
MKRSNLWFGAAYVMAFLFYAVSAAQAVPAMPDVFSHVQSGGEVVYYSLHGDEFLHYMTDERGFLIAFGEDGDLYYAKWAEEDKGFSPSEDEARLKTGFIIPTGKKVIGSAPGSRSSSQERPMQALRNPIPRHILERAQKTRMERDGGLQKQFRKQPRPTSKKGGPALLPPMPQTKSPKVLMIYVRFDNESNISASAPASQTLFNMMYDENTFGTVAHYYKTVTSNAANITPAEVTLTAAARARAEHQGIVFVTIPGRHEDWNSDNDDDEAGSFRADVVRPALQAADAVVNFAQFDTNRNGILETSELSIGLIVHGYEESAGLSGPDTPSIWGHAWALWTPITLDGVRVSRYFAEGAFQTGYTATPPNRLLTIGIIAHELGHSGFGFLDLYDISYTVQGVGLWSLMASGSWGAKSGEPGGSMPTALDAYHLQSLLAPENSASGLYTLSGVHQYARLTTSKPNQYFLLQARGNVGYDQGFARSGGSWSNPGVIIYHVDDDMSGSNNQRNYPHLHVAVEEAHGGTQHLSTSRSNSGQADDLFGTNGKTSFSDTTDPNAKLYDSSSSTLSGQNTLSGVTVGSINATISDSGNSGTAGATFTTSTIEGNLPDGVLNRSYTGTLTVSILGATWTLENGTALPPGLAGANSSFGSSSNYVISGTPTQAGTFNFTLKASSGSLSATRDLTILILTSDTPPVIGAHPQSQTVDEYADVTFTVTAANATAYQWQLKTNTAAWEDLSDGEWVEGSKTSRLFWRSARREETGFQFRCVVSNLFGAVISNAATLTVGTSGGGLIITTASLPNGTVGTSYNATLTATGGSGSITWTLDSGSLPYGLTLSSSGTISGTPAASGTADFTVRAASGTESVTKALSITTASAGGGLIITTASLPNGTVGTSYNETLTATGGSGAITWT